ncbi:MAG: type I polyketide synthase [Syntrophobacteraceae bacterium]|nr:type I polyketide synthase [Syntrophobacteraceae bacterium]
MKRIAIIGFSFRFPGTDTDRFWPDLLAGRPLITSVDKTRWATDTFYHPDRSHPGTSCSFAAGSLGDVSGFDGDFFGISPREAALMDPQQRLLLELTWEALENSGITPGSIRGGDCGVYVGISTSDYSYRMAEDLAGVDATTATGNTVSMAANRLSFFFDLHGPSMSVDTACSSSLAAFHLACRAIASGETTQALAGGINLHLHPYGFIIFSKASMLSKSGQSRPFDAQADGYVRSEGGGLFVLKDYELAIRDGDNIQAVVLGTGVNTDGRKKGLTIPSAEAQAQLLESVCRQAGVDGADIDYVEAHGTGTPVGDPIECLGLYKALGKKRRPGQPLPIGSVKSNLGHMETASGVAGLVKAIYCLKHRLIPPTISIEDLNPAIPFAEWNLRVVTRTTPLQQTGRLLIGVNSFGFGGANAHVMLENHCGPEERLEAPEGADLPVVVSAKSEAAVRAAARALSTFIVNNPGCDLYDIAYNTVWRREWHDHRAIALAKTPLALSKALELFADEGGGLAPSAVEAASQLKAPLGAAFVYSGNGAAWEGMGKRLLEEEAVFREAVVEIDRLFLRLGDFSIEEELAGRQGVERYGYTEIAQPALFALQVGITKLLQSRGVTPRAVAGHSVGEIAAAWASGALSLEDAVAVVYHRSRLQGKTRGAGQMSAVGLGGDGARALLKEPGMSDSLTLACINSSGGVTFCGSCDELSKLEAILAERGIFYKRLDLDYAFHGPSMDPLREELLEALKDIRPRKTRRPFHSAVTGELVEGSELNAGYWWRNIRQPVLFDQAIKDVLAGGINIFVEIGPHPILQYYVNQCLKDLQIGGRVIPTLKRGDDDPKRVWGAGFQAAMAGAQVNWETLFPRRGRFVQLPNYPWQKERHWLKGSSDSFGQLGRNRVHPLLGYPLAQHELTWENQIDTQLYPNLADHVVGGAPLLAGAGFAELALAAAMLWQPGETAEIEELTITNPLGLGAEQSKTVRFAINRQDGGFTVRGKTHAGDEPWTVHATGRILAEPGKAGLQQATPVFPTRAPDFSGSLHKELTTAVGLSYGPSYRAIDHGWVENDAVLGVYGIPDSVGEELGSYFLHPALLDCAFQLIFQLLKGEVGGLGEGAAFVPCRIGRIVFHGARSHPTFALAKIRHRRPHSIIADFSLFGADGRAIAVVDDVDFRSVRLRKESADRLQFIASAYVPRPHPLSPVTTVPHVAFERFLEGMNRVVADGEANSGQTRYTNEIDPLLDGLCEGFTREALFLLAGEGQSLFAETLGRLRSKNPELTHYFEHLLATGANDGAIAGDSGQGTPVFEREDQISSRDIWNILLADYPDCVKVVHAIGRVGLHLQSLLLGDTPPGKVCPALCSLGALRGVMLGESQGERIGEQLRKVISSGLENLPEGKRLGVLEISEGPPRFAEHICGSLDFTRSDYLFATTSQTSLEEAKKTQEIFPLIEAGLIGTPGACSCAPVAERPRFHAAVFNSDFGTLQAAVEALEYGVAHLAPGGLILFIEYHPTRWIDFVFGAHSEWWAGLSPGHPASRQQPMSFWLQQLERLGLATVNLEFAQNGAVGPYFLLGRLETVHSTQPASSTGNFLNWLIISDESGYSKKLAENLTSRIRARGDKVMQTNPGSAEHLHSMLLEAQNHGEPCSMVHLAGLNGPGVDSAPSDCLDAQVRRCSTAAAIVSACEMARVNPVCWLITSRAAAHRLPGRDSGRLSGSLSEISDAALHGFGTTMINEVPGCSVRLIDLEDPSNIRIAAAAIDREFQQPDCEHEVVITASGERFVPRLHIQPPPEDSADRAQDPGDSALRLGFDHPGQLKNLRWKRSPWRAPESGEVEIDVRATGLNFRDFMFSIGLLPDEAVANGFAGPTLGLEFSGVIAKVGRGAGEFLPGERVMGFSPSCFSNRLLVDSNCIERIPEGLSFEAAATIPIAFFTSYYCLHHLAHLQEKERVLIHGATGAVGLAAIQIARWCGAEIYATAGSEEKHDFLALMGVENLFNSRTLSFCEEILERTGGQGVDVVLNSLAGEAINRNLRVLKPFGRFLEIGKRDFYENTKVGLRPFRNNLSYFGVDTDQLMLTCPEMARKLLSEVMTLFAEGALQPLPYTTFEAKEVVDAFRYMQQARQIGKIVVTYRNGVKELGRGKIPAAKSLELPAEATYLVTGGLSGFGLRTAQWLASKGARHLVLVSRRGADSKESVEAIEGLGQRGVSVYGWPCDVTDKAAMSSLFARIEAELPPLKGIVHAAAVIEDGLVKNSSPEQIRRVLAPKVLGARYLHEMSQNVALDFFVLFSSATTLFGNPGQAAYVAANTWLEAFSKVRRDAGLPAVCVRFGAIEDCGFLARNEEIKNALIARMGGSAIQSAAALDILETMIASDRSGLGVLEVDGKTIGSFLPSAGLPKFSELFKQLGNSQTEESLAEDLRHFLDRVPDEELPDAIAGLLTREVGHILQIAHDKIDPTCSLFDMGLDSLMGVELATAIEARFGINLPVMSLSESPTIEKLAERLARQMRRLDGAVESENRKDTLAQVRQAVAQHGVEATQEEIESLAEDLDSLNRDPIIRMIR